jgi:hypothetical protein
MPRGSLLLSRRLLLSAVAAGMAGIAARLASADALRQLTLMRPATGEVARNVPFWWAGAPYRAGLAELDWQRVDRIGRSVCRQPQAGIAGPRRPCHELPVKTYVWQVRSSPKTSVGSCRSMPLMFGIGGCVPPI